MDFIIQKGITLTRITTVCAVLVVFAVTSSCTNDGKKVAQSSSPSNKPYKVVAFLHRAKGINSIYIVNADNSQQKMLTGENEAVGGSAIDTNRNKIAFLMYETAAKTIGIYVKNVDGTGLKKLVSDGSWKGDLNFDLSDERLAFIKFDVNSFHSTRDIFTVNLTTLEEKNLTSTKDSDESNPIFTAENQIIYSPNFKDTTTSKDEQESVFDKSLSGPYNIWAMNSDGARKRRLTDFSEDSPKSYQPQSLDVNKGTVLVVSKYSIDSLDINSRKIRNVLTVKKNVVVSAKFSPNGRKIVFVTAIEQMRIPFVSQFNISVMNSDGKNVSRLTKSSRWDESAPSFIDDKHIVFERGLRSDTTTSHTYICMMNINGTNVRYLTKDAQSTSPVS